MVDKDREIEEQANQIETLKKAVSALLARVHHLEKRNRANEAAIHNNARDVRNIAIRLQS